MNRYVVIAIINFVFLYGWFTFVFKPDKPVFVDKAVYERVFLECVKNTNDPDMVFHCNRAANDIATK